MALTPGTRLGPYEVVALIGVGGMGEVYRARDTKLNRDVALKVLPELLAHDPDRLTRFKREAQVLASLNHPKIAAIYGFEESSGIQALVLELVEGPTLADRLTQGPIPVEEALPIARQIAEALEAAHAQGIVHRDLKPANLKLRPDGAVKVLDFGLAKALAPESAGAPDDLSRPPTITTPAATRIGVIMGTAPYMSPEQARGQTTSAQADIWAFGVVLYEMLTGKQAFTGDTMTDVLAGIVKTEPDWRALPENTPLSIRQLLRHCLQKTQTARLHHIADARIEIDAASSDPSLTAAPAPRRSAVRRRALAGIGAAGLLLAGGGAALLVEQYIRPEPASLGVVRLAVTAPKKTTFLGGPNTPYSSISPDGRRLAFLAGLEGVMGIWVRSLDTLEARPLAGTEGIASFPPFWSPDSRSIGFFTSAGKLRKIELSGGPAQTICDASVGINPSGTWNREDVIVFGGGSEPLKRVSAAGGTPEPVTVLDQSRQDQGHHWPTFLPDGDHFFFLARRAAAEDSAILVGRLSSRETTRVVSADSRIAYDPSGYLLFVREGALLALPFDARTLRPAGDPVLIAERVRANASGQSSLTVSGNGVLAYRPGYVERSTLTWFDRAGKILGTLGTAGSYQSPQLSPDETRVAVIRTDSQGQGDVWVIDTARTSMTRLTFGASPLDAVWSPDGEQISFKRAQGEAVYVTPSSGAGAEEVLIKSGGALQDWSSDGHSLITNDRTSIFVVPLKGDRKPSVYLPQAQFIRGQAKLSFDGRWLAYRSNESGRNEVYIQSFPIPSAKWQISTEGGDSPRWRRDGKEIFYVAPTQKLMAVSLVPAGKAMQISRPVALFDITINAGPRQQYDVTSEGQRFLVNSIADESETPVIVVLNWREELKRLVPTK